MNTTLECIKFFLWAMSMGGVLCMIGLWLLLKYGGTVIEVKDWMQ